MDYREFLQGQAAIYNKFRAASADVEREGTLADPSVIGHRGGILIVCRHPFAVAESVGKIAQNVRSFVPAIPYEEAVVHTTFSDYRMHYGGEISGDDADLFRLGAAVERMLTTHRRTAQSIQIVYDGLLMNRTTVIAAGVPNKAFLDIAHAIQAACAEEGIAVRLPWGGHITVARCTQAQQADSRMQELQRYLKVVSPLLHQSSPVAIDVCTCECDAIRFQMKVHRRFDL